jgi:hypothetical protein
MTETNVTSVPWAAFGGEGLPPGHYALYRREEALEEARARREEKERATRAEERHERLLAMRMREAWARGEVFHPFDPVALAKSHEQITAEVAAEMDREDAKAAILELISGGRGGIIQMPLMPRPELPPSDVPAAVLTPAQRAHADFEAGEDRAQATRTAINDSARSINRRILQAQEQRRRAAASRRQQEQRTREWEQQQELAELDGADRGVRTRTVTR